MHRYVLPNILIFNWYKFIHFSKIINMYVYLCAAFKIYFKSKKFPSNLVCMCVIEFKVDSMHRCLIKNRSCKKNSVTNSTSVNWEIDRWRVLLGCLLWLEIYTQYVQAIYHTLPLREFLSGTNNTSVHRETDKCRGFLDGCCYLQLIQNPCVSDLLDHSPPQFFVFHKPQLCTSGNREVQSAEGYWDNFWDLPYLPNPCARLISHNMVPRDLLSATNHSYLRWEIERWRVKWFQVNIVGTCYMDWIAQFLFWNKEHLCPLGNIEVQSSEVSRPGF